ncbi:MAG: hypothetical protein QW231_00225, partial [Candidatus Bathyarchaeia archaeon]
LGISDPKAFDLKVMNWLNANVNWASQKCLLINTAYRPWSELAPHLDYLKSKNIKFILDAMSSDTYNCTDVYPGPPKTPESCTDWVAAAGGDRAKCLSFSPDKIDWLKNNYPNHFVGIRYMEVLTQLGGIQNVPPEFYTILQKCKDYNLPIRQFNEWDLDTLLNRHLMLSDYGCCATYGTNGGTEPDLAFSMLSGMPDLMDNWGGSIQHWYCYTRKLVTDACDCPTTTIGSHTCLARTQGQPARIIQYEPVTCHFDRYTGDPTDIVEVNNYVKANCPVT